MQCARSPNTDDIAQVWKRFFILHHSCGCRKCRNAFSMPRRSTNHSPCKVRRGNQQERGAATFVRPRHCSSLTSHNFRIANTLPVKHYQNTSPTTRHTLRIQTISDNLPPRFAPACHEKLCRVHGLRYTWYAPVLLLQLLTTALHNPSVQTQRRLRKEIVASSFVGMGITRRTHAALQEGMSNLFVRQRCHRNGPSHDALTKGAIRQRPNVCQRGSAVSRSLWKVLRLVLQEC